MRLQTILTLLTFGLTTSVFGQIFDPCENGKNAAEQEIQKGQIYFPRLTVNSTYTLRKMLELDYGIKDEVYDSGSDLHFEGEADCFFKAMKIEIEKKWGKGFLKKQSRIADQLEKQGIGYKDPKENGIADTLTIYLKREHLFDFYNESYLIELKISSSKDIVGVAVLSGLPYATEISRDSDKYQIINNAIHKVDKVFEPGQLRGKTVDSKIIFWITIEI